MLQYVVSTSERYSVAELAQMAIEGGCRWVELDLPEASDEYVRGVAAELKELCVETGAFLTVVDRPEVARALGLHGVQLRGAKAAEAARLREELGAEAVIGIEVAGAHQILSVQNLDIDYATLPAGMSAEAVEAVVRAVRRAEVALPIVARGEFSPEQAIEMVAGAGASGVAVGRAISDAPDPVEATTLLIEALQAAAGPEV